MVLSKNTRKQILSLHLSGMSGFKISEMLDINYRTAKKYCDKVDILLSELSLRIVDALKVQIQENLDIFTDIYSEIDTNEVDEYGEDTDERTNE